MGTEDGHIEQFLLESSNSETMLQKAYFIILLLYYEEERNDLKTIKMRKNNLNVYVMLGTAFKNTLLKERVRKRGGRRCKELLADLKEKKMILETERGSTRSQCVENSLWARLCICRKAEKRMNDML
jgi:hypothetical protein